MGSMMSWRLMLCRWVSRLINVLVIKPGVPIGYMCLCALRQNNASFPNVCVHYLVLFLTRHPIVFGLLAALKKAILVFYLLSYIMNVHCVYSFKKNILLKLLWIQNILTVKLKQKMAHILYRKRTKHYLYKFNEPKICNTILVIELKLTKPFFVRLNLKTLNYLYKRF